MTVSPTASPMRLFLILALFGLLAVPTALAAEPAAAQADAAKTDEKKPDAKEILKKLDDLWRGDSSKATMTMHVKREHWERSLTMESWTKGTEKTLIKVLKPLKERGTATLKVGTDIYNYLPKTDRTIKLSSAMMSSNWMGSHFTNDDLVKEARWSEDYNTEVVFTGERDGKKVIEIKGIPKPNAPVVWGKVMVTVRAEDWQPLTVAYFDEDGELERTMSFSDYKMVGKRLVPMQMKMQPADKPNEFTKITYEDLSFDASVSDGFFSLNNLRR